MTGTAPPLPPAPERFAGIVAAVCKVVASWHRHRDPVLLTLIWRYLGGVANRFASLAARIRAGTLRPSRPRTTPRQPSSRPRQRLPSGFAWLCGLAPRDPTLLGVAGYGSQLAHMIRTDPEMQALLAATPRMARLLRPLLRALGVEDCPGVLPPPQPPRPGKPKPPRPATPPPVPVRVEPSSAELSFGMLFSKP